MNLSIFKSKKPKDDTLYDLPVRSEHNAMDFAVRSFLTAGICVVAMSESLKRGSVAGMSISTSLFLVSVYCGVKELSEGCKKTQGRCSIDICISQVTSLGKIGEKRRICHTCCN